MNKRIIFCGVILVSFLLVFSSGLTMAYTSDTPLLSKNKNGETVLDVEEQTINARKVMKNLFFGKVENREPQFNFLTSKITTEINDFEKTSEITFGLSNEIDVDNDENTGVNGKDIKVRYFILPYFVSNPEFAIGAVFSVSIERIGNEIKDDSFSLSAETADGLVSVGYASPEASSNEIPERIQLSTIIFVEPVESTLGFSFIMDPTYESNQAQKQIRLFSSFNDTNVKRSYSFGFQPASKTQITLRSTKEIDKWRYALSRDSSFDPVFTAEMKKTVDGTTDETKLTIDSLPEEMSFTLSLTPFSSEGGSIGYNSDEMYDVSVIAETAELGRCNYALIKNTPRKLSAEWIPSRENGFYHVDIDSDGTSIYLLNSLQTPTINLSIQGLSTVDITSFWNLTNPGDLEVIKNPSLDIDLDIIFDEWVAQLDAKPTAENICCSWKSNVSGFLTLDTNQDPLSNIDLLIKGPESGVNIIGETLSAEDFQLIWTVWPLSEFNINKSGSLDFFSLSIDVFVNDQWYHLWPWF